MSMSSPGFIDREVGSWRGEGTPAGPANADRVGSSAIRCKSDTEMNGLPDMDPSACQAAADGFLESNSSPQNPLVSAAYADLERQSDVFFASVMNNGVTQLQIVFTHCEAPYDTDREMIAAVQSSRLLEVSSVSRHADRRHPLLGCEFAGAYDRFRAVHDVMGHVRVGCGFDQCGEYLAWWFQHCHYEGLARWALATELHGENSVLACTGELAEHKATLLDPQIIARSFAGRARSESCQL
jgi:hypothetical protein